MATYYKYAERSAGSQVNWAEIGKNLTDTLQEKNRIREEKKAAIDEATRQYGLTLEKSPQGENTTLNQWGLDYAADAQEARLLQDRLLKSGKLKLRDYTMMRQNLVDGTNEAFNLLDEYNAEYKEKMERAKSMDPAEGSQYLEQWLMAQAEGFANFKDSKLYINPTTFAVNIAKNYTTKNGVTKMSDNPDDYTTVNDLRNRIKSRFDKFDVDAYLEKQVALLGPEIRATITAGTSTKVGQVGTIEDPRQKENAEQALQAIVDAAFAGNPTNISSILTNTLGLYSDPKDPNAKKVPYTFTFDEYAAGGNVIYLKNVDGKITPEFTDEQEKVARDYMLQKMNMMITHKETINVYTEPRPATVSAAASRQSRRGGYSEGERADFDLGNLIGYLYSGTDDEIDSAIQGLKARGDIQDVQRFGDRVAIKFKGETEYEDFDFVDNKEDFIAAIGTGLGVKHLDALIDGAYGNGNDQLSDYETYYDFIGLNPNSRFDQIQMALREKEWRERQKNRTPRRSSDQQGGGLDYGTK